jgi:hypothetical protein
MNKISNVLRPNVGVLEEVIHPSVYSHHSIKYAGFIVRIQLNQNLALSHHLLSRPVGEGIRIGSQR